MKVGGEILSRWDRMDIEVIDFGQKQFRGGYSSFFFQFALGNGQHIFIAIGMAARLQPPIQLGVVEQQYFCSRSIGHPGRARDVARKVIAMVCPRMKQKFAELFFENDLFGIRGPICLQQNGKGRERGQPTE